MTITLKEKPRWVLPPPESVGMHPYAFTINIDSTELPHILFERYVAVFKHMRKWCHIEMRPEYSSSLKLHYHGTIILKDYDSIYPLFTFLNDIKKSYTYVMKRIVSHEWELYCIKQRHIMKSHMLSKKLLYRVTNWSLKVLLKENDIMHSLGMNLREDLTNGLDYEGPQELEKKRKLLF